MRLELIENRRFQSRFRIRDTGFGKGRGFTLLLGHSAAFMENAGFRTLLLRGAEWAATGQVNARPIAASPGNMKVNQ